MKHSGNSDARQVAADAWAIGLSGLCLVHCLALPSLVVFAPAMLGLEQFHWQIHLMFLAMAVVFTALAVLPGKMHGRQIVTPLVVVVPFAVLGLGFMGAALIGDWHDYERQLTIIGVVLLAIAHVVNWWSRAKAHRLMHSQS